MHLIDLPPSPDSFADATWGDIAPYYETLAALSLDHDGAPAWLESWSRLEELVSEAATLASIAYTCDTADPIKEATHLRFAMEISPRMHEQQVRLARRLLELGYTRPDLETLVREFRTEAEIFREENVPIFSELEQLDATYEKMTGGMTVEWEGQTRTIPQLQPFLKSHDRGVRERAFKLTCEPYIRQRTALADLFDRMYDLRQRMARNAGFDNLQDYMFRAKHRYDYTPEDVASFHRAVEEAVVPAVGRLFEYRRERLAIDSVRPWDVAVDPESPDPLVPFQEVTRFVDRAERIFHRVDPEFGEWFRSMSANGLLDLESRQGKAPGGYCTTLQSRGRPFIFMNAVGVPDDVSTLLHEAGHCFHAFAANPLPLLWQRGTGMEAAELASMSMELLAAPHLAEPVGYYEENEVRRAWLDHLEDVLISLTHVASVDAFQSWIYTSGEGHDRNARDRAWIEIRSRFEPQLDWSGLDAERVARWYRQLHIFLLPFYYIEYGIAQLGALQVWRNSLLDHGRAVEQYKSALALGGTRSLPEIYQAAGARLVFDTATMKELVEVVEGKIEELRGSLARA